MVARQFRHVSVWVFDLDNTLYPPESRLFDLIEVRMTAFVMRELGLARAEADRLRALYWRTYGTTLSGLMHEHGVDPVPYLHEVHDIPLDRLAPDERLSDAIAALPGRKIVYTNGAAAYGERVVAARGLTGLFDAVYGIEHAGFHPKPAAEAFQAVFARDGLDPRRAAMFEADARNLAVPHSLGMRTIHVAPEAEPAEHVHHHTGELAGFLRRIAP